MKAAETIMSSVIAKVVLGAVVLILAYLLVIRPIFKKVGIIETKEDRARDKQIQEFGSQQDSPFSPNYYKGKIGAILMTKAKAIDLAGQLDRALGNLTGSAWEWILASPVALINHGIGDDEDAVFAVFRQLKTKDQLSFLSDIYQQEYKKDLYLHLVDRFDDSEMDIIHSIVKNLL